jgi:hypothetical protein
VKFKHSFFSVLTPWWRAWSYDRAVLLAVCRQGGADTEGLVQQHILQNVEVWLLHRNYLHAVRDGFHPWRSPQGTFRTAWQAETHTDLHRPIKLSKCEAYTFLAGSLGSLSITLWFLPVL